MSETNPTLSEILDGVAALLGRSVAPAPIDPMPGGGEPQRFTQTGFRGGGTTIRLGDSRLLCASCHGFDPRATGGRWVDPDGAVIITGGIEVVPFGSEFVYNVLATWTPAKTYEFAALTFRSGEPGVPDGVINIKVIPAAQAGVAADVEQEPEPGTAAWFDKYKPGWRDSADQAGARDLSKPTPPDTPLVPGEPGIDHGYVYTGYKPGDPIPKIHQIHHEIWDDNLKTWVPDPNWKG